MVDLDKDGARIAAPNEETLHRTLGARELHRSKRTAEIMAASIRVLGEGGHAAFSMRKVAAAAGVRLNTVQHFYGDLKALLLATVRTKVTEYIVRYQGLAADERLPAQERIAAILDDVFAEIRKKDVSDFYLEAWTLGNQDAAVAEVLQELYAAYFAMFAGMVRQCRPGLSEAEAHVIAALLGSVTEGAVIYARYGNNGTVPLGLVAVRLKAHCMTLVTGDVSV